jgi:hypothetical protein
MEKVLGINMFIFFWGSYSDFERTLESSLWHAYFDGYFARSLYVNSMRGG